MRERGLRPFTETTGLRVKYRDLITHRHTLQKKKATEFGFVIPGYSCLNPKGEREREWNERVCNGVGPLGFRSRWCSRRERGGEVPGSKAGAVYEVRTSSPEDVRVVVSPTRLEFSAENQSLAWVSVFEGFD